MAGKPLGEDFADFDRTVGRAFQALAELNDAEADFVSQMADRLDRYGEKTFVSEKQHAWIERIDARLNDMGVA